MSPSKLIPMDFSMSYEKLICTCIEKIAFLRRDQAELAARGITILKIDEFEAECQAFIDLPSNITEVETSSKGFTDRDKQIVVLSSAVRLVLNIATDTFSPKSSQYKAFNVKGLSKMNANELYNICPNVVKQANNNFDAMEVKGLTALMLTNITTQAATLLPLISATPILVGEVDAATVVRRTAANKLYAIAKGLSHTGYVFYLAKANAIKTENYVLYDGAGKVVDRDGTVKAAKMMVRKTAGIKANTEIRLKVKSGTDLVFYFGMRKTSLPTTSAVTVPFNPNIFLKTTAKALGYNLKGGIIHFIIYNPNDNEADFLAKIG